jgi:hypothetical protein
MTVTLSSDNTLGVNERNRTTHWHCFPGSKTRTDFFPWTRLNKTARTRCRRTDLKVSNQRSTKHHKTKVTKSKK